MKADKLTTFTSNLSYSSLSSDALNKEINEVSNASEKAIRKLVVTLCICLCFMLIEGAGGYIANSLAIMTDAAHLLSDCVGFVISIFSIWLGRRPNSTMMTFGFHRSEILGAFVSVVLIYGLTIWLVVEGIHRIYNPIAINGFVMLLTAFFGLGCNILMATTLHDHHGHSHGHKHSHDEHELSPESHSPIEANHHSIIENDNQLELRGIQIISSTK